jgi:hypothetical protein
VPRILGRLWRSGARRTPAADEARTDDVGAEGVEVGRRLEEARQRLREAIPPPPEDFPREIPPREYPQGNDPPREDPTHKD